MKQIASTAYESLRLEGDWKIPPQVRPLRVVSMTVVSFPLYSFPISDNAIAGDAMRRVYVRRYV